MHSGNNLLHNSLCYSFSFCHCRRSSRLNIMKAIRLSTSFSAGRIHRLSTTFAVCTQKGDIMKRNFKIQVRKLPVKQKGCYDELWENWPNDWQKVLSKSTETFYNIWKIAEANKNSPLSFAKVKFSACFVITVGGALLVKASKCDSKIYIFLRTPNFLITHVQKICPSFKK